MDIQILIYLSLALIAGIESRYVRMIGGEEAKIEEFPYLVQIKLKDDEHLICAGAIITSKHILTAAHCIYNKDKYFKRMRVHTSKSNLTETDFPEYEIEKYNVHPGFEGQIVSKGSSHFDVAILTLKEKIIFNDKQRKIALPTEDIVEGSDVTMVGWGSTTYPNRFYSDLLQKITVKIMKFSECVKVFPYPVRLDQICTYKENVAAATGDSGGPVISNGKLIGIISYSVPWIPNTPQIQSNVFRNLDYIRSIIR